jgi:hypothetical protein
LVTIPLHIPARRPARAEPVPSGGVKVSLVPTVKDARPHVEEFLASVRAQTRPPDEVLIVGPP